MNITDIQNCADYYQNTFLETFYIVTTYSEKSFILIGEKENFPHLMGINQDVELIRYVLAFDKTSKLIKHKEYKYNYDDRKQILEMCERNHSNLLINSRNLQYYSNIAEKKSIHCIINGKQY